MANDHNVDVCLLLAHSAWVREGLALWGLWFGVEGICWAGTLWSQGRGKQVIKGPKESPAEVPAPFLYCLGACPDPGGRLSAGNGYGEELRFLPRSCEWNLVYSVTLPEPEGKMSSVSLASWAPLRVMLPYSFLWLEPIRRCFMAEIIYTKQRSSHWHVPSLNV